MHGPFNIMFSAFVSISQWRGYSLTLDSVRCRLMKRGWFLGKMKPIFPSKTNYMCKWGIEVFANISLRFSILFRSVSFIAHNDFNIIYLAFQFFGFGSTSWKLFQKSPVSTKLDIDNFIWSILLSILDCQIKIAYR